jgi:hypothetical protein
VIPSARTVAPCVGEELRLSLSAQNWGVHHWIRLWPMLFMHNIALPS